MCRAFDRAWSHGVGRPPIAEFLEETSSELRPLVFVELVAVDWERRLDAGETPDIDEYRLEFIEFAGLLDEFDLGQLTATRVGGSNEQTPTRVIGQSQTGDLPEFVGEFRIVKELGRGGMGIVFAAHQQSLDRMVALKILPSAIARDTKLRERFKREASATARLRHPNIAPVHGFGQHGDIHYFAMDLIDGVTLSLRRRSWTDSPGDAEGSVPREMFRDCDEDKPLEELEVLADLNNSRRYDLIAQIGKQAAEALDYAHSNGVLHRDVKPSNLMLDQNGHVWLMDFGLVVGMEESSDLTETGEIPGTLQFMPPESLQGGEADVRSDVYSLGLTLYELLALRPAFDANQRSKLWHQTLTESPVPARQVHSAIPLDLDTIVRKATERNPEQRYSSAMELAEDLGRFLENRPIKARRVSLIGRAWRWCRRRPPQAGLTVSIVTGLCIALGAVFWNQQVKVESSRFLNSRALSILNESLQSQPHMAMTGTGFSASDIESTQRSLALIRQAAMLLDGGEVEASVSRRVRSQVISLENKLRKQRLFNQLEEIQLESRLLNVRFGVTNWGTVSVDEMYSERLAAWNLHVDQPPEILARRLQELEPEILYEITIALNHWYMTTFPLYQSPGRNVSPHQDWLAELLDHVDHDAWRTRFRAALYSKDRSSIIQAFTEIDLSSQDTRIIAFASNCEDSLADARDRILADAVEKYPLDFWLNQTIAMQSVIFSQHEKAI